jgi:IS605 OrfB family transposase
MITIKLPYKTDKLNEIKLLQKQYSNIVRYAYNRFKEGKSQKDIYLLCKLLNNINLNSWLIQCAITESDLIYKNNGIEKVIFGSKKQFYRRIKGLISNEELKDYKLLPLYIIGQKSRKGNRLFSLNIINNNEIIFNLNKNNHIKLELPKLRNNYKKLLYKLEQLNNIKNGVNGLTYSIRLSQKYIHISFEEKTNTIKLQNNRYIGLDLNPNEIGLSIKEDDKILEVRRYILNIKENNHQKIEYEMYQISKKISQIFKSYNCKFIFIEELTVKIENHNQGKLYNKKVNNQWIRNKFINNLEKRINIIGGKLFKINPAYSSFIGNMIYNFDDSINASLEIARRGYEVIIIKNKKFYPDFSLSSLKDRWKEYFNDGIESWKEFYLIIKNLKLKYRVSLKNKVFSHLSQKSNVHYYSYIF